MTVVDYTVYYAGLSIPLTKDAASQIAQAVREAAEGASTTAFVMTINSEDATHTLLISAGTPIVIKGPAGADI